MEGEKRDLISRIHDVVRICTGGETRSLVPDDRLAERFEHSRLPVLRLMLCEKDAIKRKKLVRFSRRNKRDIERPGSNLTGAAVEHSATLVDRRGKRKNDSVSSARFLREREG